MENQRSVKQFIVCFCFMLEQYQIYTWKTKQGERERERDFIAPNIFSLHQQQPKKSASKCKSCLQLNVN